MTGNRYYDALETRAPEAREAQQMAALAKQVAHAKAKAPYFAALLKEVDPAELKDRAALASLPVTRKADLSATQKKDPPFGGLAALPLREVRHVFMSPGPLFEPSGYEKDAFRFGRALWAAGVRAGDIVHNTFSYHLTPAGAFVEQGAHAIGCPVFPAGVGNTEQQLEAIAAIRPTAYAGTPSFLRILLEKGREAGIDTSSLKRGLVGGEALPPSLRQELAGHGVDVLQSYGTADLGLIAYESPAKEGMIVDEGVVVEIVEPGGSRPVADGETGEVVVTTFNPAYPLIRFATGDLSAVMAGTSPCGRTNLRLKGWLGRADQSTKVKGMFVHPGPVAEVVRRHPELKKGRLVVTSANNVDVMTLRCEAAGGGSEELRKAVAASLQAVLKLRGEVEFVPEGSLPNDFRLIEDARTYR